MIDYILQQIGNYIVSLINYVANLVNGLLGQVVNLINAVINQVVGLFNALVASIQNLLAGFLTTLQGLVQNVLSTIAGYFINAWNLFFGVIQQAMTAVQAFINNMAADVRTFVETVVSTIRSWIDDALTTIRNLIDAAAEAVVNVVNAVRDTVAQVIGGIIESVVAAYDATIAVIQASFDLLFQGATSIIETVNSRIGDLAGAFTTSLDQLIQNLLQISEEQFAPIREVLHALIDPFVDMLNPRDQEQVLAAVLQMASPNTLALRNRADAYLLVRALMPTSKIGRFAWNTIFAIGMSLYVYSGIANANAQVILQEFSREYSWQLMSPADVAQAYRRGKIERANALEILGRHGYPQPQANMMLDNYDAVPAPGDLTSFLNRGLIGEAEYTASMFQNGLSPRWTQVVKDAAQIIPPVQDLITMAVKEAFTPSVIQRFGLMEDFPPEFATWAQKQGLSTEWAQRYWAAHWGLPSVQMGYEMLHRGIIGEDDLDLLLRTQDITPFWREKLKLISFANFTRVDIRRMHALGILDEAQVIRAYQDIGYDPEKAALMMQFTVQLNQSADPENPDDLGKLTRASVLNFYGDGLLTREAAIGLLVEGGNTPAAAALYISDVDFERERKNRNAEIGLIVELAEAGTITMEEATDRLNRLGIAADEVARALAAIVRAQNKKTQLPTKAEGMRWFKKGIIQREQLIDLLRRLGYADAWVIIYVAEADAGEPDA